MAQVYKANVLFDILTIDVSNVFYKGVKGSRGVNPICLFWICGIIKLFETVNSAFDV